MMQRSFWCVRNIQLQFITRAIRSSTVDHGALENFSDTFDVLRKMDQEEIMTKMRVMQVANPKSPLELVEREIPQPERGYVRIKVQACGVCHSDSLTKEGLWPGIQYPRVPGHEVAGVIDAI